MRLLISISTVHFSALRARWSENCPDAKAVEDKKRLWPRDGLVIILDWSNKKVLKILPAQHPYAALLLENGKLMIFCDRFIEKYSSSNGSRQYIFSCMFNNIHGVQRYRGGYLIASSGVDSVLFIDASDNVYSFWNALDAGFTRDRFGRIRALLKRDHSDFHYDTKEHTTHVNSVAVDDDERVFVSLFHQGVVAEIVGSGCHYVARDLRSPHDVQYWKGNIFVADTGRGSIGVCTRYGFNEILRLPNCGWLQSFTFTEQGTILCVNQSASTIIETTYTGRVIDCWEHNKEWKVACVRALKA